MSFTMLNQTTNTSSKKMYISAILLAILISIPALLFYTQHYLAEKERQTAIAELQATMDKQGGAIGKIIISDTADEEGNIESAKTAIPGTADAIYTSTQITSKSKSATATAILTRLKNGATMGPIVGKTTNVSSTRNFSFSRDPELTWPSGEYELTITLESGATRKLKFNVG